ncbi:MAG: hypothetical protein NW206_16420 [Hyphomonadaceae bacterium]|nr:hypothetical protein [Hyphomonadaceae bacterium]
MKRAIIAAMIASTLMAGLAAANPPAEKGSGEAAASGRTMDAPYLAVPVVRDGRLANYLFVSVRFEIAQGVDLWRTREQAQFLRDALVRAAHANQLAMANDPNRLDDARAIQVFRAAAVQVLGERAVGRVTILATHSSSDGGA